MINRPTLFLLCLFVFPITAATATVAAAAPAPLDRPAALEPDVTFWRRVYTEITTKEGFVHDDQRLDIVYETVRLSSAGDRAHRASAVDADGRYVRALRAVAGGKRTGLSKAEQRVVELWGPNLDKATLLAASKRVRFQLGQADRFREGLIRSGAWADYVRKTITDAGLPGEIAALPHVESSFNPAARSKVGAAGMWQFMDSTGRRFMRIDNVTDERLDPYKSTRAAALLMRQNYEVTKAWPLAITAYNHGASGMRRASAQLGTRDIATVVRKYKSRTFGFASRNFYVALLAAVDVDSDPDKYFGPLQRHPPDPSRVMSLPSYISASTLAESLGLDEDTLARLNPSLKPVVWNGTKRIPQGFQLRIPASAGDPGVLLAGLPANAWYSTQTADLFHVVQRGETLSSIAPRYGARVSDLVAINGLSRRALIRTGQKLILPAGAANAVEPVVDQGIYPEETEAVVETVAVVETPTAAVVETVAVAAATPVAAKPVTSPVEVAPPQLLADPNDYSVASDRTIRVQEGETIGHYADWLGVRASEVRRVNAMRGRSTLVVGRRLKLEFSKATPEQFEAARLAYHQAIQEQFFAKHRIVATSEHVVRRGESMWILAERRYNVPVWLLRQYNPDLDLAMVRPATRVVIPVLASPDA
jgi:membrane-bound lytic murein transglycosylase D